MSLRHKNAKDNHEAAQILFQKKDLMTPAYRSSDRQAAINFMFREAYNAGYVSKKPEIWWRALHVMNLFIARYKRKTNY